MRGIGFPKYIVATTDSDEQSTDKKAFTALLSWCKETVLYSTFTNEAGEFIRYATKKKMSEQEKGIRAWKSHILDLITHYKQAIQARNLFLDGNPDKKEEGAQAMLQHIRYDGRIHCNFMQLTTTARLSASGPNLQNIANEIAYFKGAGIRTMFVPAPGHDFIEVDYNSQEMRILAYLAGEQNLMDVFMVCATCGEDFNPTPTDPKRPFAFRGHRALLQHEAKDLHRATAALVFKVAYADVTDMQRTFAKRVNFGLNYGQGAKGLSEVTGLTLDEAKQLIEDYMEAYPGIRVYQSRKKRAVYKGENIPNAYGRWKHNYGVKEMQAFMPSGWQPKQAANSAKSYDQTVASMYRGCVNFPVQSTPADIMGNVATALADVWGVEHEDWKEVESLVIAHDLVGEHPSVWLRDRGIKMVNLVHDDVKMESPKGVSEEATKLIEIVMEGLPFRQLGWYLPVDSKISPYWGYKKDEEEMQTAPLNWTAVAEEQRING
jgi:DNA polymerase I-like protein with 3'-5' exonuclease and polymerase domains